MFLKILTILLGVAVAVQAVPAEWFVDGNKVEPAHDGGFKRFSFVTAHLIVGHKLARSSAPHYHGEDKDQNLTSASINFLKEKKITHVISLSSEANAVHIKNALKAADIKYTPLPVKDFGVPTNNDFVMGYNAFKKSSDGVTLVWCGYGHGRTGTMVSALQIYDERKGDESWRQALTKEDYDANEVEEDEQIAALEKL